MLRELDSKNEEFDKNKKDINSKEWILKKLEQMFIIDQDMRKNAKIIWNDINYLQDEKFYIFHIFHKKYWNKVDYKNTEDLKEILKIHGWITISSFGKAADNRAFIIVQHADHDIVFQKKVLSKLEKLYLKNETDPKNYAYLYDRVAAIGEKQLQRYGTQGRIVDGKWEPFPVEDPEKLDERRKKIGLSTMEEYKKMFK